MRGSAKKNGASWLPLKSFRSIARADKIADPDSQGGPDERTEGSRSRCGLGGWVSEGGKVDLEHNAAQCRGN